jgi:hypothetical protein
MSKSELPGGDKAWFERRGTFWNCQVVPVSPAGWALIAAYVAGALGVSLFFFIEGDNLGPEEWIGWAALFAAMTILFLVTVFRMSAPAADKARRRRR